MEPAMGFNWKLFPAALNWALLSPAKFKVAWLLVAARASPSATVVRFNICFMLAVDLWLMFLTGANWFFLTPIV
jgi:hypothetical protein